MGLQQGVGGTAHPVHLPDTCATLSSILGTPPKAALAHGDITHTCPSQGALTAPVISSRSISAPDPALHLRDRRSGAHQSTRGFCTGSSGSGTRSHAPGARAQIHVQTVAGALRRGCRAASLLPGLPPASVPGRNSLSPVRSGQLDASRSDFPGGGGVLCRSMVPSALCSGQLSSSREGRAGGKAETPNLAGTLASN